MDTNKLTTKSRDAVSAALRNALTAGNPYAEPSHLLHALLEVPGNTVAPLIAAVGGDPAVVSAAATAPVIPPVDTAAAATTPAAPAPTNTMTGAIAPAAPAASPPTT